MTEKLDPYREALVVETATIWPAEFAGLDVARRTQLEAQLHAQPEQAAELTYIRLHSGFCREITVTAADVARLSP
jgi:hypothetical protein